VYNAEAGGGKPGAAAAAALTEIGYMNVIPKCISSLSKYPHYENLPETYVAINDYLLDSPLEGRYTYDTIRYDTIRDAILTCTRKPT